MGNKAQKQVGFQDLSLSEVILAALAKVEYLEPTPIQAGMIPLAVAGDDILGQARTGTGKTAAFIIPILQRLKSGGKAGQPQALILVPTRELAVQVRDESQRLSHGHRARTVALYGGKPIREQIDRLRRGAEIVVGTPGRVLDLIGRRSLDLKGLHVVVLDEADRMLDIGFRPDIEKILRQCPRDRQTFLLSATIPSAVERLARRYMRDPKKLNFSPKDISVDTIEQHYFTVEGQRKFDLLVALLARENPRQAIIFCRTKRGTDRVYRRLGRKRKSVDCIHGDLTQGARDEVMGRFRGGKTQVLVATDVVGRGIDVTRISHIINYDIPQFCDDYIHRVGRTGRMGREGVAYTFVTPEEGAELTRIEVRINLLLKRDEIPGFEAVRPATPPEPPADDADAVEAHRKAEEEAEKKRAAVRQLSGRKSKRYRRAL